MTAGSGATARARATRCCWPPDSVAGLRSPSPLEPDQGQSLVDPGLRSGRGAARSRRCRHREVGEQRPVLEDHADPAALGRDEHVAGHLRDGGPADGDPAGVGSLEAGDDPQQGGLAAAARTEKGDDPSRLDRDGDVVEDRGLTEALRDRR